MATKSKSPAAKKSAVAKKTASTKTKVTKKVPAKSVASKTVKPKKKVTAVPKGYHSITPYMIMHDAAKAIAFYQKVFKAKVAMKMDKPGGKIGHAELVLGDSKIMLADEFPEMGARSPRAFGGTAVSVHYYTKDVDGIVKGAVAAGAKLLMPVQDMFYGDRIGTIEDPFGHKWHISTHIEDVTPAVLRKRMAAMAAKK